MSIYVQNKKWKGHLKTYMNMDSFPKIGGYNFDEKFDFRKFIESYNNMGFQGSNLGVAISIFKDVIEKRIPLYVSFTGNMISSGNRELITYLVKNKKIITIKL